MPHSIVLDVLLRFRSGQPIAAEILFCCDSSCDLFRHLAQDLPTPHGHMGDVLSLCGAIFSADPVWGLEGFHPHTVVSFHCCRFLQEPVFSIGSRLAALRLGH